MTQRLLALTCLLFAATVAGAQDSDAAEGTSQAPAQAELAQAPAAVLPEVPETDSQPDLQDIPLTNEELAALGLDREDQGLDTSLRLSGFMDVNYIQLLNPTTAPLSVAPHGDEGSFVVGRLNLYLAKNLTESFRMMAEVRFTYAPNGTQPPYPGLPVSYTETLDYNSSGANIRWGGILIERAYGEWTLFPALTLRLGAFLTPYGIWNVDHGSPVFIAAIRPYTASGRYFPERQTGLEAFGQWGLTSDLSMRYHLTLSNGFGPVSEYRDLDSNKAIGGRLAFEYVGLGSLQVGGSGLYGRNSEGTPLIGIGSDGVSLTATKGLAGQADIVAVGADVLWKYRGLQLQAEWVAQWRRYTDEGRARVPAAGMIGVPLNGLSPDAMDWAGYVLAGYQLPWWNIMPFASLEYQRVNAYGIVARTTYCQYGLNIRATDAIVLKLSGQSAIEASAGTGLHLLATQVAWAF